MTAQISGIINSYTKVTDIDLTCNFLTVTTTSGFSVGDKVLIIQMKGASVNTTNTANFGDITAYNNAGNYEFAEIIDIQGLDIYLKYDLLRSYTPADLVQLVTIPQYIDVSIVATLTAQPWDGNTGGVLVFEASGTVTMNADIDVSGLGFRGGIPNINNPGNNPCSSNIIATNSSNIYAAGKGESISQYILGFENGSGKQANGGGGGLSNNTGGGGGGNYANGGKGGNQAVTSTNTGCPTGVFGGGNAGLGGASLIYSNAANRIFLGGGGGAGQQNNLHNGGRSTPGGNGGGIIILKASAISGNGFSIKNDGLGSGLSPAVGDAAGGGGGGGTVAIDANIYSTILNVNVSGGDGDNVTDGTSRNIGPGGGGGGGVIWVSSSVLNTNILTNLAGGASGIVTGPSTCACNHGAVAGNPGSIVTGLLIPEGDQLSTPCSLPLHLIDFKVSTFPHYNTLQWTVVSKPEISHFVIYRSLDGKNFEVLENKYFSSQLGQATFSVYDHFPSEAGKVYYRLVQIDKNGTSHILATKAVARISNEQSIHVFPNPFSDHINIKFLTDVSTIQVLTSAGKVVYERSDVERDKFEQINALDMPHGLYIIKVMTNEENHVFKVCK